MRIDPTNPWLIEGEMLREGIDDYILDLADCVELPAELGPYGDAAELDLSHVSDFDEWWAFLHNRDLLLPVEQSCNSEGLLLGWDMRAVRLWTLPPALLAGLHFFFDRCPRHTQALLVHWVFWLVRFERIQRRGTPRWTPTDVVLPEPESAFFRPSRLTTRR